MNKVIVVIICIIIVLSGCAIGIQIYNNSNEIESEYEVGQKISDECTNEYQYLDNQLIEVSLSEEKISPNCQILLKKTYTKCMHTNIEKIELPTELINKTRDDVEKKYPNWNIEKYSGMEIILSKEYYGECGQHYVIRKKDDKVCIYRKVETGEEIEYEDTDIGYDYLAEEDKKKIMAGIEVIGKEELNKTIEDFE